METEENKLDDWSHIGMKTAHYETINSNSVNRDKWGCREQGRENEWMNLNEYTPSKGDCYSVQIIVILKKERDLGFYNFPVLWET
jgi:hypothetical protein